MIGVPDAVRKSSVREDRASARVPLTIKRPHVPDFLDLAVLALFTAGSTTYAWLVGWSRMRRLVDAGVPGARLRIYRSTIAVRWTLTLVALLLLMRHRAGLATILVVAPPEGLPRIVAVVLVLYTTAVLLVQARRVARMSAEKRDALRKRLRGVSLILPHGREELRWFLGVALTAGICEEILYRGFALWALQPWCGFYGAVAISTVLFALAHGYQGRRGALGAAGIGVVFVLMLVLCRSLVPAIVVHAIFDLIGGHVGWTLFRSEPQVELARAAA